VCQDSVLHQTYTIRSYYYQIHRIFAFQGPSGKIQLERGGTAFRNLSLAYHHLNFPFHHLAMPFRVLTLDGPHCIFWSVNFLKIITTVATRGQISRLNVPNSISAGALPQTPLGELTVQVAGFSWI